jgi:hypothetical protein
MTFMKKMNWKRFVPLVLLGVPSSLMAADDVPKAFAFARYQGMMDRSPFAVATAVTPVAAPSFAKDLYVANAARTKEGAMVTIASNTDKNWKRYLTTEAPVDGIAVTGVEWSDKVGATKVTISKDGQTATIGFNEALLRQAGPGQNAVPQQKQDQAAVSATGAQPQAPIIPGAQPIVPGAQPNAIKPMPVPALPTAPPRVRGVIPRNPAANAPVKQEVPQPEL